MRITRIIIIFIVLLLVLCLKVFNVSFFAGNSYAYAAEKERINTIKNKTAPYLVIDSILHNEEDTSMIIKSLMQLANLEGHNGNYIAAISYGEKVVKLAREAERPRSELPALGFLYYTYNNLGLSEKANYYLKQLEALNSEVNSLKIQLYIHLAKASASLEESEIPLVFEEIQNIDNLLAENPELPITENEKALFYQLKGTVYSELNRLDSSYYYYEKSLATLVEDSITYAFVQIGLAKNAIIENDDLKAKENLATIEQFVITSDDFRLEEYYLITSISLAQKLNDKELELNNQSRLNEIIEKHNKHLKEISNNLLKEMNLQEGHDTSKKSTGLMLLLIVIVGLLVLMTFLLMKNKKEKLKYKAIVQSVKKEIKEKELALSQAEKNNNLESKENSKLAHQAEKVEPKKSSIDNGINIPEETIDLVMKKLDQFENSNAFLKNDISLAKLATKVDVNTKYLSHILNHYKNQDFNNYINTLRIKYILKKLVEEEEYLKYKIAYLAEESGFSSHSRFSAAFKQITGTTPSSFIDNRKKELKLEKNN